MQEVTSLYIHFPLCMHLCNYCDFYKKKLENDSQISDFEKLFLEQWERHEAFLTENNRSISSLDTLYLGGGTPSLWRSRGARFMNDLLKRKKIELTSDCEYTIEVDPGTCSNKDLDVWRELGVNRFSIGVQAYSDNLLKLMDRKHTVAQVDELLKYMGSNTLNFSVDLMIGLPTQDKRDLTAEITSLINLGAKHFSVYILKTRKNYAHAKSMPVDETVRSEYLHVCEQLDKFGFAQYEISNFALSGFQSKHNKKYWDYSEVAALGPNSTGLIVSPDTAMRYQWKSMSAGHQIENISGNSLIIEKLFLGLRTSKGIDLSQLFTSEVDLSEIEKLKKTWLELGYIDKMSDRSGYVKLLPLGFLMCDSIIDDIFKHISF